MNRTPFERLIMITNVLSEAGPYGRPALKLAESVGYQGTTDDSKRDMLARDIRAARSAGLEIDNAAEPGAETRYVLRPRDSRVKLAFSDEERGELARAALLAHGERQARILAQVGAPDPAAAGQHVIVRAPEPPAALDQLLHAVAAHCLVRFTYSGRDRVVHPYRVEHGTSGWWLNGLEETAGYSKTYTVDRMSNTEIGDPGSATLPDTGRPASLDPLSWAVDDPIMAQIECFPEFVADVELLLGINVEVDPGDPIRVDVPVTNRALFLSRIMELGFRVRLLGPPDLRDELRTRLLEVLADA